jgi:hypothetical protein
LGSRRGLRSCLAALVLACGLGAGSARAADEPDAGTRMAARELAVAGAEAFDKHDYVTALDRFHRAEQLYKVPSIAVMVARCLARVGRVVESVDKYEETMRMPLDAASPEAFQRAVADAAAEVEAVRARVARVEVHLPSDAPAGAVVTLDDKPVPAPLIGVPTPVDPGSHRLAARAPGRAPYAHEFALAEGARQSVEITFAPEAPRAQLPPGAGTAGAGGAPRRGPAALTITLLTGGGLALAVGAVTGIAALSAKSKLDEGCKPGCPANLEPELDSFRLNRTLSYVGFGVGLAAAGTGAYLLLHEGSGGSKVGALVLPGGAALAGSF